MQKYVPKKKRYKEKKYLSIVGITVILVVTTFLISLGWSAFSQKLELDNLSAKVQIEADIRVTGIALDDASSNVVSSYEEYNVKSVSSGATLPNADSYVTYKVEITNFGNVEMGIFSIEGLPDNLEYTIEGYKLKDKICNEERCTLGAKKDIYIKISYKKDGFNASDITYPINLKFDFRAYHKVTYVGFNISTSDFPQEIMDGDNLSVNLPGNIDKSNLKVTVNGESANFEYTNSTIQLANVLGDVTILYVAQKNTLYAFLENLAEDKTDQNIDFTDPNVESGVFLHYETRNDPYPIYYYRGTVDNNVTYANYCWKIVRTTESGGIKLLYNDKIINGTCTSDHDYLGSEPFNEKAEVNGEKYPSPSQTGFMYGEVKIIEKVAPSYLNDTTNPKVIESGTIFGNNVTYDNGKYTLVDTITITDLNKLEDDIRGGKNYGGMGHHYTCLSKESSCQKVYYIYFDDYGDEGDTNAQGLFGMALDDGLNVTETLDKILFNSTNENDSYVKNYLDEFFEGTSSDFRRAGGDALIDHKDELEDVQWCNDRTIAGYHGWDLNNDNHAQDNKYLHFKAFGRLIGDGDVQVVTRPDITCDDINDTFTVSSSIGNGKLTYPIGLLTADEAVLAGAIEDSYSGTYLKMNASKNQTFMTPYYISDDHVRMFALDTSGKLSSVYASTGGAIRPAIAIKSTATITGGDGSTNNPYVIKF